VIMPPPRAKYFNTTGPCDPQLHYMLPPTPRLPEARALIEMDRYFVLHAPRQTGKTTMLRTLASDLTAAGDIAALSFSCERAGTAGDDIGAAETILLKSLRRAADLSGWPEELLPPDPWPQNPVRTKFGEALSAWCRRCPRRIVLFLDEIDALQGASLISILSQLRDGHNIRPDGYPFPTSVVLCGLRDLRDYKVACGGAPDRFNAASPFNILADSLRLGDFTTDQIAELYDQHTQATGQEFTKDAVDRVFELTQGQPWLVNAGTRRLRPGHHPVRPPGHRPACVRRALVRLTCCHEAPDGRATSLDRSNGGISCDARPLRYKAAGRPTSGMRRSPVGSTKPSDRVTFLRKLLGSSRNPHTAS